jgi:ABC-2 type transport system ATP-binding protein
MMLRSLFVLALLALAACERAATTAPAARTLEPALTEEPEDHGPPGRRSFGADSYTREGPYTGAGSVSAGLQCDRVAAAWACNGYLASDVDGTMLDVTLEYPSAAGPFPLVVLIHGWAGSKRGDGDIAGRLVADGFAVLRYSTRGFGDSYGRVNLADLHLELADLRSMIGQVVDNGRYRLNGDAVAVTGASYGGGHSWLALLTPRFSTRKGTPVRIRTVVPIAPWTDLLYALMPNGSPRNSLDRPGALKFSYASAFYWGGQREPGTGPEPWYDNYPAYLRAWYNSLVATEPTVNLLYSQIRDGLAGYRSIWWQHDFWAAIAASPVPIFQVQGFTDDLFPLDEAKRTLLAIQSQAPGYPIASYFGDLGHPGARNKAGEIEYVMSLMHAWLTYYLKDVGPAPEHIIRAAITRPANMPFNAADVIRLASYGDLSNGQREFTFAEVKTLANPGSGLPSGPFRDPVLEAGLVAAGELRPYLGPEAVIDPTAAAFEVELSDPLLIAGQPRVTLHAATTAPRVQLNVRLFGIDDQGHVELITRGTYTFDTGGVAPPLGPVELTIPTHGNLWQTKKTDRLRLEITNVDAPFLAPSQVVSETTISNVRLLVPVRQ